MIYNKRSTFTAEQKTVFDKAYSLCLVRPAMKQTREACDRMLPLIDMRHSFTVSTEVLKAVCIYRLCQRFQN